MSKEYKIGSLVDLLELEDDQIDRLCAELPSVIKHAKSLMELIGAVGEAMGEESPIVQALTPMTWIDDGKKNVDIKVSCEGEQVLKYEVRKA